MFVTSTGLLSFNGIVVAGEFVFFCVVICRALLPETSQQESFVVFVCPFAMLEYATPVMLRQTKISR
ncbi:hypothetical protein BD94_0731 [Elizabethkingia anophelis NUHP1]|uniref:Uncharacterized protein n=1 Tax=Elizabethkingia anophelis NUHP1 TaxID=1338011 RepID=A0A077EA90_9FLAO|nr:hypothetical protein BD94_0731 [Elizabethkingia anophelis NUHP1]